MPECLRSWIVISPIPHARPKSPSLVEFIAQLAPCLSSLTSPPMSVLSVQNCIILTSSQRSARSWVITAMYKPEIMSDCLLHRIRNCLHVRHRLLIIMASSVLSAHCRNSSILESCRAEHAMKAKTSICSPKFAKDHSREIVILRQSVTLWEKLRFLMN